MVAATSAKVVTPTKIFLGGLALYAFSSMLGVLHHHERLHAGHPADAIRGASSSVSGGVVPSAAAIPAAVVVGALSSLPPARVEVQVRPKPTFCSAEEAKAYGDTFATFQGSGAQLHHAFPQRR